MKSLMLLAPGALLVTSLTAVVLLPRVAQAHGDARLSLEPLHGFGHGLEELRPDHLQRARLAQQEVLGAVHGPHAAAPDALGDLQVAHAAPDQRIRLGQGWLTV